MAEDSQLEAEQVFYDGDTRINYDGPWVLNNYNGVDSKGNSQLQTFHSTSQNDSTLFIPFNTSSNVSHISVKGVVTPGEARLIADYTVDNGSPVQKEVPIVAGQAVIQPYQDFFDSSVQGPGLHNLSIRVLGTGSGRNYSFQSLNVNDADGNGVGNGETTIHSVKKDVNTGVIVGAVLGSMIFVLLVLLVAFYYWRRKRMMNISNDSQQKCRHCGSDKLPRPESFVTSASIGISPFILPPGEPAVVNESRPASNGSNSTSLPPYSTLGARTVHSLQIDNSPSVARASYANSHDVSRSTQGDSEQDPFKDTGKR